jgi:uncharacterized protein YjiS (DUF1127 family)
MLWKQWKRWLELQERRRTMRWMLLREDDHWLNDIGLTREDLQKLLSELDK